MKNRKAFTMIELVFVVAVIGILAAIAIPKFAMTRNDAIVTKAGTTVAALRSAIATERQKRILKGKFDNITATEAKDLLEYDTIGNDSRWSLSGNTFTFTAPDGTTCAFSIAQTGSNANKLIKGSCNVTGMEDL